MQTSRYVAAAALLTACTASPPPRVDPVPVARTPNEAFDCSMRVINELQYTVVRADRSAGFLRAHRVHAYRFNAFEPTDYDVLTVTVVADDRGRTLLRVVPELSTGTNRHNGDYGYPTREAQRDQHTVTARCGAI